MPVVGSATYGVDQHSSSELGHKNQVWVQNQKLLTISKHTPTILDQVQSPYAPGANTGVNIHVTPSVWVDIAGGKLSQNHITRLGTNVNAVYGWDMVV